MKSNKILKVSSALLSATLLLSSHFIFAEETESTTAVSSLENTIDSTLFDAGVVADEGVEVSRDATLDYVNNTWTMEYHLTNTGKTDASVSLMLPITTSLSKAVDGIYTFEVDSQIDFTESIYFSPLLSTADISKDTITASQLYEFRESELDLPNNEGVLYTFKADEAASEAVNLINIIANNEDNFKIYPIGCSYASGDGLYEISANADTSICYLFLTGEAGSDYEVSALSSDYVLTEEIYSLDKFMELSCDLFWDQTPLSSPATKEALLALLDAYLDASKVTVSLDLLPSLQWLSAQQLFEIFACDVTVEAGQTVTVSIVRDCELSVNEVSINPILTTNGTALKDNFLHILLRDDYTRASIRGAKSSYDRKNAVFTLTDTSSGSYTVRLGKTPIWEKSYQYIIPMSVVMIIFLLLCIPAYLGRKKQMTADEDKNSKSTK